MPIAVLCPGCDSRLNAPDTAAGKTVKCPKCQAPMVIPAPDAEPEVVDDPAPKKKPAAPTPKKPAAVKADVEVDDDEDDRPRKKKRPADDEDEDDDDPPRKKKRRKAKAEAEGTGMVRNIIGAVVLVLALGIAAFVWWDRSRDKEPANNAKNSADAPSVPPPGPPPGGPGPGPAPQSGGLVKALFPTSTNAARQQSSNSLKQIGLAMHSFSDVNTALPAGIYDSTGKVGLSWRVAILPYIEYNQLYAQFKLDEPWDGPTNKKLIAQMPRQYAPPGGSGQTGFTYLRTFAGPDTMFPPAKAGQGGKPAFGLRIAGVTDGLSNTAMVVEAGDPVEWTKPDELEYAAGKPLPKVGGVFGDGVHVLFGDGSPAFVRGTDPVKLKAMITAKGGETIDVRD